MPFHREMHAIFATPYFSEKPEQERASQISKELNILEDRIFPISCTEGGGVDKLMQYLVKSFEGFADLGSDAPIGASSRVQEIIRNDVVPSLQRFLEHAQDDDVVFESEEIRYAAEAIGRITGERLR
ncbi:hypothetical protein V1522DRAFT_431537 [Lipomyces starkeyi]